ncbi:MAG: NfeD family protein [Ruminococcaceae bacterium]|nr:NfeD family protein [Oscillospiraceae bacterium]
MYEIVFWLCAMIVLGIMEAATVGLVCIWFAGGALAALIAAALGAPVWLQIVVFFVVSAGLLALFRPFARKFINSKGTATNVDANIGKTAVVIEPIDNLRGTGRVMIGSVDWTARSADGSVIEKDALVRVLRIEGVKVCVERVSAE